MQKAIGIDSHIIYSDGSSRGNPGPGGYGGMVFFATGKVVEFGGHEDVTTNNRMELMGAIIGLRTIRERATDSFQIIIKTDSAYTLNGATKWVYGWEKNGWRTSTKEPVLNQDLWQMLMQEVRLLTLKHEIIWEKVKGHAGIAENERADMIATGFADNAPPLLFTGDASKYTEFLKMYQVESKTMTTQKSTTKKSSKEAYSYVSMVNGTAHADKTWAICEKRVKGVKGAKYQKVFSKQEEEALIQDWTLGSLLG